MSNIKHISTLEFYGYGENNNFAPVTSGSYKVKVSDGDNIITVEKDGSLYAMVGLSLQNGVLTLLDVAHDNSELASVEFENAGHIENCAFNESEGKITFDIFTLNGGVESVEIDVQSLVDIYEEGQGIQFGEGSEEGKKTINIKLNDNEEILQVDENGLKLSDEVITEDELDEALLPFATIEHVDGEIERVTDDINEVKADIEDLTDDVENLQEALGFDYDPDDEDSKTVQDMLDEKADADDLSGLDDEVGELDARITANETSIENLATEVENIENGIADKNTELDEKFNEIDEKISDLEEELDGLIADAKYDSDTQEIQFFDKDKNVVADIDLAEIFNDEISPISDVKYNAEDKAITLILTSGSEINIDMHDFLDIDEVGDGLELDNNGTILVKIDETSDEYLTVSEDGIKLSIADALNDLASANEDISADILAEKERATSEEEALGRRIDTINDIVEANKSELDSKIDTINSTISVIDSTITTKEETLKYADQQTNNRIDELENTIGGINDEISNLNDALISNDDEFDELKNSIDSKIEDAVAAEKERAEGEESRIEDLINEVDAKADELQGKIDELDAKIDEVDKTETPSEELYDKIEAEITARTAADAVFEGNITDINSNLDAVNRRLSTVEDNLDGFILKTDAEEKIGESHDDAVEVSKVYTDDEVSKIKNDLLKEVKKVYDEKFEALDSICNALFEGLEKVANVVDVIHTEVDGEGATPKLVDVIKEIKDNLSGKLAVINDGQSDSGNNGGTVIDLDDPVDDEF